jgi:hypothetical protein
MYPKQLGLILVVGASAACLSVSSFEEPYMQEAFIGSSTITPSIRGIAASAAPAGVVVIRGDSTGRTVTISGLPKNDPMELLPKWDHDPMAPKPRWPTGARSR